MTQAPSNTPDPKASSDGAQATESQTAGSASGGGSGNVKIYDRPERKTVSPALMLIGLVILLIIAFLIYKALH